MNSDSITKSKLNIPSNCFFESEKMQISVVNVLPCDSITSYPFLSKTNYIEISRDPLTQNLVGIVSLESYPDVDKHRDMWAKSVKGIRYSRDLIVDAGQDAYRLKIIVISFDKVFKPVEQQLTIKCSILVDFIERLHKQGSYECIQDFYYVSNEIDFLTLPYTVMRSPTSILKFNNYRKNEAIVFGESDEVSISPCLYVKFFESDVFIYSLKINNLPALCVTYLNPGFDEKKRIYLSHLLSLNIGAKLIPVGSTFINESEVSWIRNSLNSGIKYLGAPTLKINPTWSMVFEIVLKSDTPYQKYLDYQLNTIIDLYWIACNSYPQVALPQFQTCFEKLSKIHHNLTEDPDNPWKKLTRAEHNSFKKRIVPKIDELQKDFVEYQKELGVTEKSIKDILDSMKNSYYNSKGEQFRLFLEEIGIVQNESESEAVSFSQEIKHGGEEDCDLISLKHYWVFRHYLARIILKILGYEFIDNSVQQIVNIIETQILRV